MPSRKIEIRIEGENASGAAFDGLAKDLRNIGGEAENSNKGLSTLTKGLLGVGAAVGIAAGAVAVGAVKMAADFDKGMREVNTMLLLGEEEFKSFGDEVLAMTSNLGVDAVESTKALYQAISAGVPKENVLSFMEIAAKSAIGGVTTTEIAVDGLTAAINAFQLPMEDASHVADVFFAAVKSGKTTMEEMSSSLFNVAPTANAVGVSLEETAAAMAALTTTNVPTSVAATQLRAALQGLVKPSDEMTKIFQAAGYESAQFALEQDGLVNALNLVADAADGDIGVLQTLLGSSEAVGATLSLTGAQAEVFASTFKDMTENTGQADAAFQQMEMSTSRMWDKMTARAGNFMIQIGSALLPVVNDLLNALGPILQDVMQMAIPLFKRLGEGLQQVATIIRPFIELIGGLFKLFGGTAEEAAEAGKTIEIALGKIWETLGDAARAFFTDLLPKIVQLGFEAIIGLFSLTGQMVFMLMDAAGRAFQQVLDSIGEVWEELGGIGGIIDKALRAVVNLITSGGLIGVIVRATYAAFSGVPGAAADAIIDGIPGVRGAMDILGGIFDRDEINVPVTVTPEIAPEQMSVMVTPEIVLEQMPEYVSPFKAVDLAYEVHARPRVTNAPEAMEEVYQQMALGAPEITITPKITFAEKVISNAAKLAMAPIAAEAESVASFAGATVEKFFGKAAPTLITDSEAYIRLAAVIAWRGANNESLDATEMMRSDAQKAFNTTIPAAIEAGANYILPATKVAWSAAGADQKNSLNDTVALFKSAYGLAVPEGIEGGGPRIIAAITTITDKMKKINDLAHDATLGRVRGLYYDEMPGVFTGSMGENTTAVQKLWTNNARESENHFILLNDRVGKLYDSEVPQSMLDGEASMTISTEAVWNTQKSGTALKLGEIAGTVFDWATVDLPDAIKSGLGFVSSAFDGVRSVLSDGIDALLALWQTLEDLMNNLSGADAPPVSQIPQYPEAPVPVPTTPITPWAPPFADTNTTNPIIPTLSGASVANLVRTAPALTQGGSVTNQANVDVGVNLTPDLQDIVNQTINKTASELREAFAVAGFGGSNLGSGSFIPS